MKKIFIILFTLITISLFAQTHEHFGETTEEIISVLDKSVRYEPNLYNWNEAVYVKGSLITKKIQYTGCGCVFYAQDFIPEGVSNEEYFRQQLDNCN